MSVERPVIGICAAIELSAYEAAVTDWEKFRGFERL